MKFGGAHQRRGPRPGKGYGRVHAHAARPFGEHEDTVGEQYGLVDAVCDHQGGGAAFQPDALQLEIHSAPSHRIERSEGLIEQQELRLQRERAGDRHPLPHSTRQFRRPGVLETLQTRQGHQLADAVRRRRETGDLEGQPQVTLDRPPGQQRVLLEGYAQRVLRLQLARRLTVDLHLAEGRLVKAGEQTQHCALAASRGTDQRHEFAVTDLHVERTQGSEGFSATRAGSAQEGSRDPCVRQESPCSADCLEGVVCLFQQAHVAQPSGWG